MKIHKNNFLKDLGPTADQIQRAYLAEKAAKNLRTESEMAVKMRKVKDLMDLAAKKEMTVPDPVQDDGKNPPHQGGSSERRQEDPAEEQDSDGEGPAPPGAGHIDIRV